MMDVQLINLASVGIFGMILSAAFCDVFWTRAKILVIVCCMAGMLLLQGYIYLLIDAEIVSYIYPIITHFPLILVLWALNKKGLWSAVSVLTAYLCCQIRRWLALLIVAVCSGSEEMQNVAELVLTLPILLILLRFAAPSVRAISHYTVSVQFRFGLVPALYYGFDYLTRIYTSLLFEGALVAVEFMPFVCSVAYMVFMVQMAAAGQVRSRLERTQDILNLQMEQAVREIEALRESQQKTWIYRHDMRHHMQYLSTCIENGQLDQAQNYIREICIKMETNKVTIFCENEAANLIFSFFSRRIHDCGILLQISAKIPRVIAVSESDLCVLLSNALENALHACQKQIKQELPAVIEVSVYEKGRKLFLQIINSCDSDISFENGIPVTDSQGHGIGVRSICAIVEQYDGIYSFSVKENQFILRVSI